ncbi:MAG: aldehyde dehydrogenase family protein, partial [Bacteroidetes bacterium]|nr:aldehyde dehydrogenase family protein [Bacteroidota bacterium]
MEKFLIYTGGELKDTGNYVEVINSFDGKPFALACKGSEKDLEQAIIVALSLEKEARDLPSYLKYNALQFIAGEIERNKERFTSILAREACKPWKLALGEVDRAIATFVAAAEEAKRLPGEYLSIDWTAAGQGKEGWVKYFPVGLVGGISPFNFPINLAIHKIAPAIAAGCPIILKPSTSTPLSTLELAKVIDRSPLPKGMVSILPLDRRTGNLLVTDERIKLITFTGSPAVGWNMKKEAGKKRVVLELGGNAGVIVSPTANLELAVKKCLGGSFAYAGQVCIHTQRIIVHDDIFDEFAGRMVTAASTLKEGDPMDPATDISAMINEENAVRVEKWIEEAISEGATLLAGGKRKGCFVEPTILSHTKPEMKVCSLEVFGPVVTLERYSSFEKAVQYINNSV